MEETTKQLLTTIAENQPKIKELGYNEGFSAGKKSEYDEFWDMVQKNGNRRDYAFAFSSMSWTKTTFRPKYNITTVIAERMFYQFNYTYTPFDLVEHLDNLGISLNFTGDCRFYWAFGYASITRIGTLDMSKANLSNQNAFAYSKIAIIDKIIFSEDTLLSSLFVKATELTDINEIEGVIRQSIDCKECPLSIASLKSIITHLKDYSSDTANHYAYTVTFKTSAFEALEAEGATSPNGNTWTEYIDDLKWNLTLA